MTHEHAHGKDCGHVAIKHGDHVDYVHDGHLHHVTQDDQVEDHHIEISAANPAVCKRLGCQGAKSHMDSSPRVPHGDHLDFLVEGRLHHVHDGHCDDHGAVLLA